MLDWWIVALIVLLVIIVAWAYFTAQRLNRLHIRTDAARASLNHALDRRAAVVAALYPETKELAQSAEHVALDHGSFSERATRERSLAAQLREGAANTPELVDANIRVELAHRFYNDAVADTRALRLNPAVRILRLGGTAPLPEFFDY